MEIGEKDRINMSMDTMDFHSCSLCGTSVPSARKKYLYGMSVCRRCRNRFLNRRQFAFIIDLIITIIFPPLLYFYILVRDSILGSSLGKSLMGLQVIEVPSGRPCGFGGSVKRNLPLFIPLVNLWIIIFEGFKLGKGPRKGDLWANTLDVSKRSKSLFLESPVISHFLFNQACKDYIKGDFDEAVTKCNEITRKWPEVDIAKDAESLIRTIENVQKSQRGQTATN